MTQSRPAGPPERKSDRKKWIAVAVLVLPVACKGAKPERKPLATEEDKTLYAVGLAVAKSLEPFALTPAELDLVQQGVRDGVAGKPEVKLDEYQQKVQDMVRAKLAKKADAEKTKGAPALAAAEAEKGAIKTESGSIVVPEKEGDGPSPGPTDTVKVHYTGKLVDGTVFDSSVQRGQPIEFPLNQVIPCWTQGLQKMKVGGKAKLVCPASAAYGEQGRPPVIPGNAVLTFDVELLDVKK